MAIYNKGILGAFTGKVGPVVGSQWRGKNVLRSLPRKSNRIATDTQLLQRKKFGTVTAFLSQIQPVITRYYGVENSFKTRRNQAMSYHMKEAVTFVDPDFEMLYHKVQVSKGDLISVENPTATAIANTGLSFAWGNNAGQGQALENDTLVLVVYEPTLGEAFFQLNLALRSDETVEIPLPSYLSGLSVHVWLAVASADEKRYATSKYLGTAVLT
jgi:hypothetical protein